MIGPDGAVVDGVLHLGADGTIGANGYRVTPVRTATGIRYDVTTPSGEQLSWTAPALQPRRILVLGGARSGKSTAAENLLAHRDDVLYVATGGDDNGDPAWAERIAKHRARRPAAWGLAETIDLVPLLRADHGPALLIDCLTLWLTRTMDACDIWTTPTRLPEVEQHMATLVQAWSQTAREVIAVSNEVGSGVVPATPSGILFRDLMGRLNTALAQSSDQVLLTTAGRTTPLP